MERYKRERAESKLGGELMTANDHVRSWRLKGKKIRERAREDVKLKYQERGVKEEIRTKEKSYKEDLKRKEGEKYTIEHVKLQTTSARKDLEVIKRSRSPKKNNVVLDIKPFVRAKTAREEEETHMEVDRFRKPSDRMRNKDSMIFRWQRGAKYPIEAFPTFTHNRPQTNHLIQGVNLDLLKEPGKKEKKSKKHKHKTMHIRETPKAVIPLDIMKRKPKEDSIYPTWKSMASSKQKELNDSSGEAVVIYERHNRKKYLHPQTGDGYRFEQIAFTGSGEATMDLVQSKRSLSEPQQKSVKEFYVARRRTRFHLEPNKMPASPSDFHSAIDFLKERRASIEFKKFEEVKNQQERSKETSKCDDRMTSSGKQAVLWKSKSSMDLKPNAAEKEDTGRRLKQTAEKKLNLHREMMRAEKVNKKKFWESIERSLNYRCALADMFSSQSFVSQNESSKFFSSTDDSTGIFVQESVIEKISSYQGFHRFMGHQKPEVSNNTKMRNLNQQPGSAFRKMQSVLGSILIKEDEEEEEEEEEIEVIGKQDIDDCYSSQSSSHSIIHANHMIIPYEKGKCSQKAKHGKTVDIVDKPMIENSHMTNSSSELEFLMAKLSKEIRKCSKYIETMNLQATKKKSKNNNLSVKFSASDGKLNPGKELSKENKDLLGSYRKEYTACPVVVYPLDDRSSSLDRSSIFSPYKENRRSGYEMNSEEKRNDSSGSTLNKSRSPKRKKSYGSLISYSTVSLPSSTDNTSNFEKKKIKGPELPCCDDCKFLKRRIVKLERDLERIEKKMPLMPEGYQNSIKNCLERLKATSETVLKRLKSCAKLRALDHIKGCCKFGKDSRRSSSAPEPILNEKADKKVLLKSSNSDYHLNVGMEITMENVDPKTGQKLRPSKTGTEQEGNIQCMVYKDGEEPLCVLDTDFSYNPETGMLFKKKTGDRSSSREPLSEEFIMPTNSAKIKRTNNKMEMRDQKAVSNYEITDCYQNNPFRVKSPKSPRSRSPSRRSRETSLSQSERSPIKEKLARPKRSKSKDGSIRGRSSRDRSPRDRSSIERSPRERSPRERSPRERSPHERSPRERSPRDRSPRDTRERMKAVAMPSQNIYHLVEIPQKKSMMDTYKKDKEIIRLRDEDYLTDTLPLERGSYERTDSKPPKKPVDDLRVHCSKSKETQVTKQIYQVEKIDHVDLRKKSTKIPWSSTRRDPRKSADLTSRIPTRRKPTPSYSKSRIDNLSQRSSVGSVFKSEANSFLDSSITSIKALSKTPSRPMKSNQSLQKMIFKKRKDEIKLEKSTQTFKLNQDKEEDGESSSQIPMVNVGIQAQMAQLTQKHQGSQAIAILKNECIQTFLYNKVDSAVETIPRASLVKPEISIASQTDFLKRQSKNPVTFNVAVQANSDKKKRPTVSVGLQTNLPTPDDLKHLSDLQIQKKVNMAIAELCFHLNKAKEQQKV